MGDFYSTIAAVLPTLYVAYAIEAVLLTNLLQRAEPAAVKEPVLAGDDRPPLRWTGTAMVVFAWVSVGFSLGESTALLVLTGVLGDRPPRLATFVPFAAAMLLLVVLPLTPIVRLMGAAVFRDRPPSPPAGRPA